MKILFLLSSLSQPRCVKRINAIAQKGFDVEVYGYSRGFYEVNKFSNDVLVTDWGEVVSGSGYLKKMCLNFKNIRHLLRQKKEEQNCLYYAFGFDLAFVLSILKVRKYIYESSDLIYTYFHSNFIVKLFRTIDKFIIKRSFRTVFTSAGFAKYLYSERIPDNCLIQPNKVSPYFQTLNRKDFICRESTQTGLVFSYVGAFRYPNTVFRFAKIIGEHFPEHKFYFYGDSLLTSLAKEYASKYTNVSYFGAFKSPDDLSKIYKSIDITVACYDSDGINERIAEPNKLYESICFCKPIVVSTNTYLSERVSDLGVGFSIDAHDDKEIINFINSLSFTKINEISNHELSFDADIYIDSIDNIVKEILEFY